MLISEVTHLKSLRDISFKEPKIDTAVAVLYLRYKDTIYFSKKQIFSQKKLMKSTKIG